MLRNLSLQLVEQWWVKPIRPAGLVATMGRVSGTGFAGTLGSPPPVYEPGGAVLLTERIDRGADLAVLERAAAGLGAVLAVVPAAPGSDHDVRLERRQWTVASQWYVGQPQATSS